MSRAIVVAILLFAANVASAQKLGDSPATDLVIRLSAYAASCALEGMSLRFSVEGSAAPKKLQEAHSKSTACAVDAQAKGKDAYKTAVQFAPGSKDAMAKVYARWLAYIQSLADYAAEGQQKAAERGYAEAVYEMRAITHAK